MTHADGETEVRAPTPRDQSSTDTGGMNALSMAADVVAKLTPTTLMATITGKSTTNEPQPTTPQQEVDDTDRSTQTTVVRIKTDDESISPLQSFEYQDITPTHTEDPQGERNPPAQDHDEEEPPFDIHDRKEFLLATGDTSSLDPNADAFLPVQSKQARKNK